MLLKVSHLTRYSYSQPVRLGTHRVQLHPRREQNHTLLSYSLEVDPPPADQLHSWDPQGNHQTELRFDGETDRLAIHSSFHLLTIKHDPGSVSARASSPPPPCVRREPVAPEVAALARAVEREGEDDDPMAFLHRLNQRIHQDVAFELRPSGNPRTPQETLLLGRGACRDLAVLFMAACRHKGFASRFVSGYQARSHSGRKERFMHAWPEVHLAGVGWCGFDPTHGLTAGEGHVPVAAALDPQEAAPIRGTFVGEARSSLHTELLIDVSP